MMPDLMPFYGAAGDLVVGGDRAAGAVRDVSRVPGGGRFFCLPSSYTDGCVKTGHVTKASFLNESTRGLFADYMRERGGYYG